MNAQAAIIQERLRRERRTIFAVCAASFVAGFIQPHAVVTTTSDLFHSEVATRVTWIGGPIFFGTIVATIVAVLQRNVGRNRDLELCEQSAPIYGRQLARATAVVPCIVACFGAFAYWFAQFMGGLAAPPAFFALVLASVCASTLVALSATLRVGFSRYFYLVLGAGVGAISFLLGAYVDVLRFKPVMRHYPDVLGLGCGVLFCFMIGFIALRQYGEALARYDPLPP